MTELANHELMEKIGEGAHSAVYLGRSKRTHELLIIKVARNDGDVARNIATLRHQYDITKDLDLEGIVRVRELEVCAEYVALIMERFDGASLQRFIEARKLKVEPAQVAKIAIQLVDTLGAIHARNILHRNINPSNIIINEHSLEVKITDFSIASLLPAERLGIHDNISRLEGTLQYMSPEQTGRINRSIDYRSDYYSLGVTLYQLSTGRLPFDATDPMELVHCHIARTPAPPHQILPSVPEVLSKVIMKLLSKTAEDRYQSAFRLKADLELCLDVAENGAVVTDFVPGRGDRSDRLQVSEKLYGRREEVEALLAAEGRVSGSAQDSTQGQSELVLVAGDSGIGKSSIVNEIHKRIARQGGYFIAGKFDQLTRHNPYASLIAALRELVGQLLTETEAQLDNWKKELLEAISPNGQVIVDVIPDIELIIGRQPPILPLGPAELENRFDFTFRDFIRVFATRSRPLVIFLDDLQWSDTASLNLIGTLMSDPEIQNLLLIGAYRDNEVDAAHPLMIMRNALPEKARVSTITLRPLSLEHVNELVADTLSTTTERCRTLSQHIAAKTHGNPFFIIQLLFKLHAERRLSFDPKTASWQWNVQEIEELGIKFLHDRKLVAASEPFTGQAVSVMTGASAGLRDDGAALDLLSIVKASQALASEVVLGKLLQSLMRIMIENTGAQTGFLALTRGGTLYVEAEGSADHHEIQVLQAVPVARCDRLPASMVNYVARTKQSMLIDDATLEMKFSADPYIQRRQPKSVMCAPIVGHGRLVGVFYFENNLSIGVFTKARLEILKLLSAQAWISIENAKLYEKLERSAVTRTAELRESNKQLQTVNARLKVELTERERLQQEQALMQQEIIRAQSDRLLELSTPLIPITERIMVMPVIGTLDAQRAAQMLETALLGVVTNRARVVIVDITGVASVDMSAATMLTNLAKALGLVGTEAIITGIRPAVAQALVALGVELETLRTRGDLKAGIAYAMRRTGETGA